MSCSKVSRLSPKANKDRAQPTLPERMAVLKFSGEVSRPLKHQDVPALQDLYPIFQLSDKLYIERWRCFLVYNTSAALSMRTSGLCRKACRRRHNNALESESKSCNSPSLSGMASYKGITTIKVRPSAHPSPRIRIRRGSTPSICPSDRSQIQI